MLFRATSQRLAQYWTTTLASSASPQHNSQTCRVCSSSPAGYVSFTAITVRTVSQNTKLQGTYELTANAQIWPRALNTAIGGTANNIYLIVGDLGTNSGEGLDFINGYGFLERFYSVFDTANRRVGFATTPFTTATTN